MQFDYMICPAENLGMNAFSMAKCEPNNVFVWREMPLSPAVKGVLSNVSSLLCLEIKDTIDRMIELEGWMEYYEYFMGALPTSFTCVSLFCFTRSAFRRVLCFRI